MMLRTLSTIGKGHQTHSCLIDVTLACEDANSKLIEVFTVANAADRVGNSLLQILKLRFGHKA